MKTGAYWVFDDVRSGLEHFVQADSEPRVWRHDKQWRLRFVVAPTEQLRINFRGCAEIRRVWDPAAAGPLPAKPI